MNINYNHSSSCIVDVSILAQKRLTHPNSICVLHFWSPCGKITASVPEAGEIRNCDWSLLIVIHMSSCCLYTYALITKTWITSPSHCGCEIPADPVNWPVGNPSAATLPCIETPPKSGLSAPPVNVSRQNQIRGSVSFGQIS